MRNLASFVIVIFYSISLTLHAKSDTILQKNNWEIEAEEAYKYAKSKLYSNTDSVLELHLRLLKKIEKIKTPLNKYNLNNITGICYQNSDNYDSAFFYYSAANKVALDAKDTSLIIKSSYNLALNNRHRGNYKKALELLLLNLDLIRASKNETLLGNTFSEISNVFLLIKNYSKSLEYLNKAIQLGKNENVLWLIGTSYNTLTAIYNSPEWNRFNLDTALIYADSAIKYNELAGRTINYANSLRNKCEVLGRQRKFNKCIGCLKELTKLDENIGNKQGVLINLINIGKNYNNLNNYGKAIEFQLKAIQLSKEISTPRYLEAIYYSLSLNYANIGNYQKAYQYADSSRVLNDSLQGKRISNEMAELETKYQLSEKERLIAIGKEKATQLAKEKELTELQVEKRNNWIIFLLLVALLIGVAAYLFIQNNKKKQALNEANLLKEERQKALKAVIDAQEEERKRIAKDLHDSIGQKLSGIKMGWNRVAKETTDESLQSRIGDLSKTLESTADEIRAISHKMMPIALREVGISAALKSMLENTFQFSEMTYTYDESNVEGRFKESVEITIYRIAQELVNNAIKHAKAKEINVQLLKAKENLILIVQDDGKGVDLNQFKKGHGFMNINSRLSVNSGEINLESTENQGLFAQVKIKID